MLTQNQQSIIDSLTEEFLSFNEARKASSKPFNFFDPSVLDAENQRSIAQIGEAKIINKSVIKPLVEILKSDFSLLKQDMPALPIELSVWLGNGWNGDAQYERENLIGRILIHDHKIGIDKSYFIIDYFAEGKRYTADNGERYLILDGTYRVRHGDMLSGNIYASTLSDLFANDKFVQKFTKFYRDYIK